MANYLINLNVVDQFESAFKHSNHSLCTVIHMHNKSRVIRVIITDGELYTL